MLLPLKQHSFKKLSNVSIYYTNTVKTCLKIFPITRFLGRLPGVPSTGESILNAYNSAKKQKNKIGPRTSPMGPGGAVWGQKLTTKNLVRLLKIKIENIKKNLYYVHRKLYSLRPIQWNHF